MNVRYNKKNAQLQLSFFCSCRCVPQFHHSDGVMCKRIDFVWNLKERKKTQHGKNASRVYPSFYWLWKYVEFNWKLFKWYWCNLHKKMHTQCEEIYCYCFQIQLFSLGFSHRFCMHGIRVCEQINKWRMLKSLRGKRWLPSRSKANPWWEWEEYGKQKRRHNDKKGKTAWA